MRWAYERNISPSISKGPRKKNYFFLKIIVREEMNERK